MCVKSSGFLVLVAMLFLPFGAAYAQQSLADINATSTQSELDQTNAQIAELQSEIAQLQTQLNSTTAQKQTLQSAVNALELNIKKLSASITLTDAQIKQTDLELKTISGNISTTTSALTQTQAAIADSLQQLQALDQEPVILELLSGGTLSSIFDQATALESVRGDLQNKTQQLADLKTNLVASQTVTQQKRAQLASLQSSLSQQKAGLVIAQASQTQLLQETSDKESNYQQLIAQKQAQESQFEQQLLNEGSQLNLSVNPLSIPAPGPILSWPVNNTVITQYFGNTPFATQNPQIYNGHGHDGIDLAASPGTPVHAALTGVVAGTGNTDLTCPGASFGKWIFIQHANGLSTMYAHLSTILVTQGQQVNTGDLIAYSDTTGYAIGPHLHFGVYATSGSEIKTWLTTNPRPVCQGKYYTMPVATLAAYLNPLSYLPPLPK